MNYRTNPQRGISLVEVMVATALILLGVVFLLQGLGYFRHAITQQARMGQMQSALSLTFDISRTIRSARRIRSVSPGELDLEVPNVRTYTLFDREAIEKPMRIHYRYIEDSRGSYISKEIYISTESAGPTRVHSFLKGENLSPPNETHPYFSPSYVVGVSTVGVTIQFGFKQPGKDHWVPIREEEFLHAKQS